MTKPILRLDSTFVCVSCEQDDDHFGVWTVTVRDTVCGKVLRIRGDADPNSRPDVTVGKVYRLDVTPVEIGPAP